MTSLRGLDVLTGSMSPEEKAEDQKFHFKISLMSSIIGAIIGAIVSVHLMKRGR